METLLATLQYMIGRRVSNRVKRLETIFISVAATIIVILLGIAFNL